MHKRIALLAIAACLSQAVLADELADGMNAWNNKDFKTAAAVFGKLAAAGNAEAQFQLGEMYGFGEGVAEDPVLAAKWLERAQAGGNKDAAASLLTLRERAGHKGDIAWWVERYAGEDVRLSAFNCGKPVIPAVSRTRAELKTVSAGVKTWLDCYGRFSAKLASVLPAGKAIPENIARLMSTTEFDGARARLDKIYLDAAAAGKSEAAAVVAANDEWIAKSETYLTTEAARIANATDADSRARSEREQSMSQSVVAKNSGGGR